MSFEIVCAQIDLARQKENFTYIKSYFDKAKAWGYNYILIYLQHVVRTSQNSFFDKEKTYSKAEIKKIVEYAEKIGLKVIPSLHNLSYMGGFIEHDEFKHFSEGESRWDDEGTGKLADSACLSNPKWYPFIEKYLTEVIELFPNSEYVHMNMDEQFEFAICDKCMERVKKGETKDSMFLEHIIHTNNFIKRLGKTMMIGDDWFEYSDIVDKLPRDIILTPWHYVYMSDEPNGHWTNRIKKDWLKLYDELGFRYVCLFYSHRASSVYNIDTFTRYIEKHNAMGVMATAWCRNDSFYEGAFPYMAYAAARWNGIAHTREDGIKIYSDLLGGDLILAKLIYSLGIVEIAPDFDPVNYGVNDTITLYNYRTMLESALEIIRKRKAKLKGLAKDIATDIYDYIYEIYLNALLCKLSEKIFDNYDGKEMNLPALTEDADIIERGYEEIRENGENLWKKYRKGIVSRDRTFEGKFDFRKNALEKIKTELKNNEKKGVLFLNYMYVETYNTVRNTIKIKYIGKEEKLVFKGYLKPKESLFEVGGSFCSRIATEDREIEYIKFGSYGEGAFYPQNFRYYAKGKKYIAERVEVIHGKVVNPEKVLFNDTRFAEMGYENGIDHVNDMSLSKELHEIKIYFSRLK